MLVLRQDKTKSQKQTWIWNCKLCYKYHVAYLCNAIAAYFHNACGHHGSVTWIDNWYNHHELNEVSGPTEYYAMLMLVA